MKQWWLLVLLLVLLGKNQQQDVARLKPVETLWVTEAEGIVLLWTDTGAQGVGRSLSEAVDNLHESSEGVLFLDTAEYVLLGPKCEDMCEALMDYLRPSCVVCLAVGETKMEAAGRFLRTHRPEMTLIRYLTGGGTLQKLVTEEGRMTLEG